MSRESTTSVPTRRPSPAPSPTATGHRWYVLAVLFAVYTVSYLDRQILVILAEPIKREFHLKDWQLGFLTGTAFALFYATLGIPIARLADRWHRVNILAASLAIWSAMTSLCAFSASFLQLAAVRIGVGIGEAGGSPPSVSLLSSYFERHERATAMAIYSLGTTVGILCGFVIGGWVGQVYGWRAAFLVAGLPGVALSLALKLTVTEPRSRIPGGFVSHANAPGVLETVRVLASSRAGRLLNGAAVAASITFNGFMAWLPVYMIREFSLTTREVGTKIGVIAGLAGSVGVFLSGVIADALAKRDARWHMRVPAVSTLLFPATIWLVLNASTATTAFALLVPAYLLALAYTGPTWAVLQTIAPANMRAMAAAILLFLINFVGLGLGPQLIGILSDVFEATLGSNGLRIAMTIVSFASLIGSLCYYLGSSSLAADSAAQK